MWEIGENEEADEVVKITFELKLPEKSERLHDIVNAQNYQSSLYEIWSQCRKVLKYAEDPPVALTDFAEEIQAVAGEWLAW